MNIRNTEEVGPLSQFDLDGAADKICHRSESASLSSSDTATEA